MIKETIIEAETVEEAVTKGSEEFGKSRNEVEYEILEEPKKGLFGKVKSLARVRIFFEETSKIVIAEEYVSNILKNLGLQGIDMQVNQSDEETILIKLEGNDLGVVIGRRGETLDALQYLTSLVTNRNNEERYMRVVIDSGDFREKREKTLRELGKKVAKSVVRSGKNIVLEPMNPYERRIIHSVIAETEGVSSKSIGEGSNRRVVISSTNPRKRYNNKNFKGKGGGRYNKDGNKSRDNRGRNQGQKQNYRQGKEKDRYKKDYEIPKDASSEPSTYSFEKEFLKSMGDKDTKLYGKIEFDD